MSFVNLGIPPGPDDYQCWTGYFGPPHRRKDYESQVPTPVGAPCLLCDERIEEGDTGTINGFKQIIHYECGMRSVIGSVGHQMRLCSCYGGTVEDPPGMSRRQAAIAAVALWTATDQSPNHNDEGNTDGNNE
jgi:hypothetical protein